MRHAATVVVIGLSFCAAVFSAAPAAAQTFRVNEPSNRPAFSMGWSQLHEQYGAGRGGEFDLLIKPRSRLGFVIDAAMNGFDGFSETTIAGGIRWSVRRESAIGLFGQVLAGIERCGACETTDPTVEPAVGVDVSLAHRRRVALRLGAGYRITPSAVRTFKETHVFVGLAVRPR